MFVTKGCRKVGVGAKLLEEAIKIFKKPMPLKCVKENKNAVEFYLSKGWKIKKEEMGEEPYYLMVLE